MTESSKISNSPAGPRVQPQRMIALSSNISTLWKALDSGIWVRNSTVYGATSLNLEIVNRQNRQPRLLKQPYFHQFNVKIHGQNVTICKIGTNILQAQQFCVMTCELHM